MIDLYELGEQLVHASLFEHKYNEMKKDRDYWKAEHDKLLNKSLDHSQQMMGNFLKLALNAGEEALENSLGDKK